MRPHPVGPRRVAATLAVLSTTALLLAGASGASAVPVAAGAPAACGGVHLTDATGDGHHANTDVTAGWFTRASGRLQAVVAVASADWRPAHDDSESATWSVLWQAAAGQTRYVRLAATQAGVRTFDHGTWSLAGGFVSAGSTTGSVSGLGPGGWVAIDVPEAAGAIDGAVLRGPFALTTDGLEGAGPHWVDRAPGGTSPSESAGGADYVVGPCPPVLGAGSPALPGGSSSGGVPAPTSISLAAPARVTGAQRAQQIRGAVVGAGAGLPVLVTKRSGARTVQRTVTTGAGGAFTLRTPISERTQLTASAAGLASQTLTIDVRVKVRVAVRRTASGGAVVTGTVSPKLPGRVLWLRTDAVTPTATTRTAGGRFVLRLADPRRGRFQALVIPTPGRAQRGLSNTGVIR